ncbi:3-hydroxy-3-methylglutaryl-coenzyme A reductase [Aspergillus terreus NIH2624]|uniref:3-hydroxy-3-methylglutaryl-coenzyme A reductase n=1 Tax=Aspergillus terreus (strain NIH 2624 / FGSC A1156) TaxID=341663 RepID=HMDH_ASPTN|nr:3-hydroxy-3-methylglutaryl-coenzyme A reductase [Aspergillus terreus NIH2624]Q0C8L9.1 RecName: Full=3-hydroxy-3-methylglutaryl-coenzyme A reductase; Short=HMG-CoA reductase [Aspergillus terreus NIH2624]EAU29414.1 3-hydroxy-3-methylglutaryl-coenzyme A reductase [Aspergillus terreus NIH2624]
MDPVVKKPSPGGVQHRVTKGLRAIVGHACRHPIHTLLVTALTAATTHLHVLEGTYQAAHRGLAPWAKETPLNVQSFLCGSRTVTLGEASAWRWQIDDRPKVSEDGQSDFHWALVTLDLPGASVDASIPFLSNTLSEFLGAEQITPTPDSSPSPDHSALTFRVPYSQLDGFLQAVEIIPSEKEDDSWRLRSPREEGSPTSLGHWVGSSWLSFLHRVKHAETVDLVIIGLSYLAMNMTVVSLFRVMRQLGSRFWLATSVLLSGAFAFVLGLGITTTCDVPVDMLLLFEGIPYLVLTVGFEKPIQLTRAVLCVSEELRGGWQRPVPNGASSDDSRQSQLIPNIIQLAVDREGWYIVRSYLLEIGALALGAVLRPNDSLGHFCFLAAWTLLIDAILLFTFYATILCVKLEITRIRSPGGLGQVNAKHPSGIFGHKVKSTNITWWKLLTVGGFVLCHFLQLSPFFYRVMGEYMANGTLPPTAVSPFKEAANGLNEIYLTARVEGFETRVTVLPPLQYALESAGFNISATKRSTFDGVLDGLESPLGRLCLMGALVVSLVLNNHLIHAARWHAWPQARESAVPDGSSLSVPCSATAPEVCTRPPEETEALLKSNQAESLTDDELVELCLRGKIAGYSLEKTLERIAAGSSCSVTRLDAFTRAVRIRRAAVSKTPSTQNLCSGLAESLLPYRDYNYELVHGACCENVVGYLPLPLGVAGPMVIDGQALFIPMATTEGVLVASASRGCKAINAGGGATTMLKGDGMTRGPCLRFPSAQRAAEAQRWVESPLGHEVLAAAFNATSRFARLQTLTVAQAGIYLYIRFRTTTGDAMGMNMISKGVEKALEAMAAEGGFPDMHTVTLSGNFCSDKKSAAINWIGGRGKSVIAEATIPAETVRQVLKTDVDALVELNTAKNLVGSAMAGSLGGFNAHASNLVQAVFLATGQDPAQNVESSSCITTMKNIDGNLHIAVSMPSMEVGTIGGGTILEAQGAMLDLLGVRGAHATEPGANARRLARIVAAAVLAGELSTCAALAAGHLVNAHMQHNRSAGATVKK